MYRPIARSEIFDALVHLRDLYRKTSRASNAQYLAHERREVTTKNLLSNLHRMKEHPTLHTVLEVADIFSLTLSGAHQLFGYDLEEMKRYDLQWNGGRTHIIESYPFDQDLKIDLPAELGNKTLANAASLGELVQTWQTGIPIGTLIDDAGWQKPGVFYVRVGTEDSVGSNLPPGAVALVEPIEQAEQMRPNPKSIYLLQFGDGYRCSGCVVSRGKLLLLISAKTYRGPQSFEYPGVVRIAGKIRMFALALPAIEHTSLQTLYPAHPSAPLILPWEHRSIDRLFATGHQRFQRSKQERQRMGEVLASVFRRGLSGRTERRYRQATASQPHVDALMQLTLLNRARYTDALRALRVLRPERGRFSLAALLRVDHLEKLPPTIARAHPPHPDEIWTAFRKAYGEWPSLLSMENPNLRSWSDRVVRLPAGNWVRGLEPPVVGGSFLLLREIGRVHEPPINKGAASWFRPLYAVRKEDEILCGSLWRDGRRYVFRSNSHRGEETLTFHDYELDRIRKVTGIAVPV
jgi:hypothetical protein